MRLLAGAHFRARACIYFAGIAKIRDYSQSIVCEDLKATFLEKTLDIRGLTDLDLVPLQFREIFMQVLLADFATVFIMDRVLDFLLGSAKLRQH